MITTLTESTDSYLHYLTAVPYTDRQTDTRLMASFQDNLSKVARER